MAEIDAGRQTGRARSYNCVGRTLVFVVLLAVTVSVARPARAQNWSFDARRIVLGGIGDTENAALGIVAEQRGYSSLVLPFGVFQVFKDLRVYDPTDVRFDPVRAAEYVASPLHYTFDRDGSTSGQQFVFDIVNALLSRDLNTYKGFTPSPAYVADSADDVYIPNTNLSVTSQSTPQFVLALTGGYRARITGPSQSALGSDRNGIYLAANYHYLLGFGYEDYTMAVRFDTNGQGLLTLAQTPPPIAIERQTSNRGRGMAVDVGTVLVVDRWDVGFGINGIGNQITWTGLEREGFFLESLVAGGDFIQVPLGLIDEDLKVELPVNYTTSVAYHADQWLTVGEYSRGFQGNTVRTGLEYRLGRVEFRGGTRYSAERWQQSAGAGFTLAPGVALDVAAFGTSANLERRRNVALAFSLRFNTITRR